MSLSADPFAVWYESLVDRHLKALTFQEVRRAVQALSSIYVGERKRLAGGKDLDTAGKRAAFSLYFAPLHFLAVREVVRSLDLASGRIGRIGDWGCGTGGGGAAWALEAKVRPELEGIDRHPWAVTETRWNWARLGLRGTVRQGDLAQAAFPTLGSAILCAYTLNECDRELRDRWLGRALRAAVRGVTVLVVEPISTRISGWMADWEERFRKVGGRHDEWNFAMELPERLALLDRASGLDHRSRLTCRSLAVPALEVRRKSEAMTAQ